jgi:hypothetical protein
MVSELEDVQTTIYFLFMAEWRLQTFAALNMQTRKITEAIHLFKLVSEQNVFELQHRHECFGRIIPM